MDGWLDGWVGRSQQRVYLFFLFFIFLFLVFFNVCGRVQDMAEWWKECH